MKAMSLKHFIIPLVSLLFVTCRHNVSVQMAGLQALFKLTEETCGTVNWCSMKTFANSSNLNTLVKQGCCESCSCSENCSELRNCCPDFNLATSLNDSVFHNHTQILVETEQLGILSDKTHIQWNVSLDCVISQLSIPSPLRPIGSMYRMVATCASATADPFLLANCKLQTNGSLDMTTLVPVQSTSSGIVYRNIYCYKCGTESQNPTERWTMNFASFNGLTSILQGRASSLNEIITWALSSASVNVLFEPSASMKQSHPPIPCQTVDIGSCPDANTLVDSDIKTACKSHTLPLYARVNGSVQSFRNAACMLCNGITAQGLGSCNMFYRWNPTFTQTHVPVVGQLRIPERREYDFDSGHRGFPEQLAKRFSPNCSLGHAYDREIALCRKVYCPCGMLIQNGTCVPKFLKMLGVYVVVQVSIHLPTGRQRRMDASLLKYFELEIDSSDMFDTFNVHVYQSTSNTSPHYVVEAAFWVHNTTASPQEIMAFVSSSLVGQIQIVHENSIKVVDMKVIDYLHTHKSSLVDNALQKSYKWLSSSRPYSGVSAQEYNGTTVVISKCDFCYRLEVLPNEAIYLRSQMGAYLINKTRAIVYTSHFGYFLANRSRRLLCVETLVDAQKPFDLSETL